MSKPQIQPRHRRTHDKPQRLIVHTAIKILCTVSLLFALTPVQSQAIYKMIDADGNVSYSSVKPDDESEAQIIDVPREPSQDEIDAAQQRQAKLEQSIQQLQARKNAEELEKSNQHKKAEKTLQQTIDNNSAIPGLLF